MALTSMGDLARKHKMNLLLECEVRTDDKVLGKVVKLISDKYERVSGIEVEQAGEAEGSIIVIPYEWIRGVDEEQKVVFTDIRKLK